MRAGDGGNTFQIGWGPLDYFGPAKRARPGGLGQAQGPPGSLARGRGLGQVSWWPVRGTGWKAPGVLARGIGGPQPLGGNIKGGNPGQIGPVWAPPGGKGKHPFKGPRFRSKGYQRGPSKQRRGPKTRWSPSSGGKLWGGPEFPLPGDFLPEQKDVTLGIPRDHPRGRESTEGAQGGPARLYLGPFVQLGPPKKTTTSGGAHTKGGKQ